MGLCNTGSRFLQDLREWHADALEQHRGLEDRVTQNVKTLHGSLTETVDAVKTQVQDRLDHINDQVAGWGWGATRD